MSIDRFGNLCTDLEKLESHLIDVINRHDLTSGRILLKLHSMHDKLLDAKTLAEIEFEKLTSHL